MSQTEAETVLMFRAPKEGQDDKFEKALKDAGYHASSIPVLQFNYVNLETLAKYLQEAMKYAGIVFTSQRSVEATNKALALLDSQQGNDGASVQKRRHRCLDLPCFVVGTSTQEAAEQSGFSPDSWDAGNASRLAHHIIDKMVSAEKPLLYPCGNLKKDTLATKLTEAGLSLKEVEVYETSKNENINKIVDEYITAKGLPTYVIFFSPSGVKYTADLFTSNLLNLNKIKVVAIGPTTEEELNAQGILVHSVARKPNPESLLQALT